MGPTANEHGYAITTELSPKPSQQPGLEVVNTLVMVPARNNKVLRRLLYGPGTTRKAHGALQHPETSGTATVQVESVNVRWLPDQLTSNYNPHHTLSLPAKNKTSALHLLSGNPASSFLSFPI